MSAVTDDRPLPRLPLDKTLWTKEQVAAHLGLTPDTIGAFRRAGVFPRALKIGVSPRWIASEIVEWKAAAETPGEARPMPKIPGLKKVRLDFGPGIYFLCKRGRVVYVGQSVTLLNRLVRHQRDPGKFDRVYFLGCTAAEMNALESKYIDELRPPLNGRTASGAMLAPRHA